MVFYEPLSREQADRVHIATMEVLEKVGVLVENKTLLDLLQKAGVHADRKRSVAKLPEYLLRDCIRRAPSRFSVYSRKGGKVVVGGEKTAISCGGGAFWVLDLGTGEPRPATKRDVAQMSRLTDALDQMQICLPIVVPQDVTPSVVDVHSADAMMHNTSKPYYVAPADGQQARYIIRMAAAIAGGMAELEEKTIIIGGASPNSPLRLAPNELEVTSEFAKHRIPIALLNCPLSGSGSPISLSGTLVTTLAEVLSLAVIAQLISPGTPLTIGCSPSIIDMRTAGAVFGAPEDALLAAAVAQMARYYGIPSNASMTHADSMIPDMQAGYEAAWTSMLPLMAGINLIYGSGLIAACKGASYEKLIIDNEILSGLKRILQGIDASDRALAVDTIEAVGPGGHFLAQKHTRELLKDERWFPKVTSRVTLQQWKKEKLDIWQRARRRAVEILNTHQPEPLKTEVEKELGNLIAEAERTLHPNGFRR